MSTCRLAFMLLVVWFVFKIYQLNWPKRAFAVYWHLWYWVSTINWIGRKGHLQFIDFLGHYFTPAIMWILFNFAVSLTFTFNWIQYLSIKKLKYSARADNYQPDYTIMWHVDGLLPQLFFLWSSQNTKEGKLGQIFPDGRRGEGGKNSFSVRFFLQVCP